MTTKGAHRPAEAAGPAVERKDAGLVPPHPAGPHAESPVDDLELLLDVGRAITGSLELEEILDVSAGALAQIANASNSFILLLDAEARELRGAGCSNPRWRAGFRHMRLPLAGRTLAAQAVAARRPIAVEDVAASDHESRRTRYFGEKSLLALPLLVRDEPIGCIIADDVRGPRAWSETEVERAMLVAHQIAVAIANARLYDDLRQSYAKLARAQEELVKQERLAALGEFAAVVAHEVRNPLGVIFNSLGSLNRLLCPQGDAKMLLEIVGEEAERLDRIVRDLLDFARPHEPSLQLEAMGPLVEETLHVATSRSGGPRIELALDLQNDLPELPIDRQMIRQALLNLLLNGVQAMPRGGTLRVRAARESADGRRWMRVDVSDEGSGVAPEFSERIFQPFFTTKAMGTGLGLAVVKRFVEAHHGTVSFTSAPGKGTTFSLRLPVHEDER